MPELSFDDVLAESLRRPWRWKYCVVCLEPMIGVRDYRARRQHVECTGPRPPRGGNEFPPHAPNSAA